MIFVLDATQSIGPGDRLIAERLLEAKTPVVVALNKVDRAKREQIGDHLQIAGEWDFDAYVPISALKRDGIEIVIDEVDSRLTPGPFFFPEDAVTDQPDSLLVAELIREKYLSRLHEELPTLSCGRGE